MGNDDDDDWCFTAFRVHESDRKTSIISQWGKQLITDHIHHAKVSVPATLNELPFQSLHCYVARLRLQVSFCVKHKSVLSTLSGCQAGQELADDNG